VTPIWTDAKGVQALFGLSPDAVRRHVDNGALPAPVRIGRRTLWRVADVDAALARLKDGDLGVPVDPVMEAIHAGFR
jgi:predicted DNA-binding transcriptional regulator AlpA